MKFNYFWRQVETGDANKIEFIRGGEKLVPIAGWLFLVYPFSAHGGCFSIGFQWFAMRYQIPFNERIPFGRFDYFLGGIPSVIIIEYFIWELG